MHTINLTQRFLANQPWKNPHGENQSERRDFNYFFSKVQDRKLNVKIQLISTSSLFLKVWKNVQQTQQYIFLVFCA